jgi:hypothetical protein
VDLSGEWGRRIHEDQPHRNPGAELGDYTGLPINAAARQKASSWDASILSLPEHMAKPHPAQYFMRGPGPDMRINKITDPVTQTLIAFTLEGIFGRDDRVIWMDGRPHPSEYAEHTWDGFSTGKVEGNKLTVTTTHMKYGVIQRNGVPASAHATMTEHFIRHGDFLTLATIVDDPVYLEEPFIRTSHWVRTSNITPSLSGRVSGGMAPSIRQTQCQLRQTLGRVSQMPQPVPVQSGHRWRAGFLSSGT